MLAAQAFVRPRFISPATGDSLPLLDAFVDACRSFQTGVIEIIGAQGSGRRSALKFLSEAVEPALRERIAFPEDKNNRPLKVQTCTPEDALDSESLVRFEMAPWTFDDLVECCATRFPSQANLIVPRLKALELQTLEFDLPEGKPLVWNLILQEFAADPNLTSVTSALRRWIRRSLEKLDTPMPSALSLYAFRESGSTVFSGADPEMVLMLSMPGIRTLLAAELLAEEFNQRQRDYWTERDVVPEQQFCKWVAEQLTETGWNHVRKILDGNVAHSFQAMCASLLNLTHQPRWNTAQIRFAHLENAQLHGVNWPNADLHEMELTYASLQGANLEGANLNDARLLLTNLSRSNLRAALLNRANAVSAKFVDSDLTGIQADRADFSLANLTRARMNSSHLAHAGFRKAKLDHAQLRLANLHNAHFSEISCLNADFTGSHCTSTHFDSVRLSDARWNGVEFHEATFHHCDCSLWQVSGAEFQMADFYHTDLSASSFRDVVLVGARFHSAGLAYIDWPGVNLAGSDLRGVQFHFGTSRSGLVDSTIASEGTRTGFYQTDYDEPSYRPPEQIRVANLTNANLRGARTDGVDFYRVDLRGALMDAPTLERARETGAILD